MDKNDKVYLKLIEIGFTDEQIQEMVKENVFLTKVISSDIEQEIKFLKQYELTNYDIVNISIVNPWILTESFERMRMLEKQYKLVGIDEFKKLLLKQPIAMSLDPLELKNYISKQKEENRSNEEIREELYNNLSNIFSL